MVASKVTHFKNADGKNITVTFQDLGLSPEEISKIKGDKGERAKLTERVSKDIASDSQVAKSFEKTVMERQGKGTETQEEKLKRLAEFDYRKANQSSFDKHQKELDLLSKEDKQKYLDIRAKSRSENQKSRRSKSAQKAAKTRKRNAEQEKERLNSLQSTTHGKELLKLESQLEKQRQSGLLKAETVLAARKAEYRHNLEIATKKPTDKQKEYDRNQPPLDLKNGNRAKESYRGESIRRYEVAMTQNRNKKAWGEPALDTSIRGVPWTMKTPNGEYPIFGAKVMPKGKGHSRGTKEVRLFTTPDTSGNSEYLRVIFKAPRGSLNPGSESLKIAERFVYAVGQGKSQKVDFWETSKELKSVVESVDLSF